MSGANLLAPLGNLSQHGFKLHQGWLVWIVRNLDEKA
jgi:hypothetical protein